MDVFRVKLAARFYSTHRISCLLGVAMTHLTKFDCSIPGPTCLELSQNIDGVQRKSCIQDKMAHVVFYGLFV